MAAASEAHVETAMMLVELGANVTHISSVSTRHTRSPPALLAARANALTHRT